MYFVATLVLSSISFGLLAYVYVSIKDDDDLKQTAVDSDVDGLVGKLKKMANYLYVSAPVAVFGLIAAFQAWKECKDSRLKRAAIGAVSSMNLFIVVLVGYAIVKK